MRDRLVHSGFWGPLLLAAAALIWATPAAAARLKTSSDFDNMPASVLAYVLELGVEQRLRNPADVSVGKGQVFTLGIPGSDLNGDGVVDYFVAACMFEPAEAPGIYQTNGYAFASGALLLCGEGGEYQTIAVPGMLSTAKAGASPTISVLQRNYQTCGDDTYLCETEFRVDLEGMQLIEVSTKPNR